MAAGVCLGIVTVIASNVGKQKALMQTAKQGRASLSHRLCPESLIVFHAPDQVEVSMAPHEQVISAEQTGEGLSRGGPDGAIV